MTKLERAPESISFLKTARKYTEPLPESAWATNREWMLVRRNIFKQSAAHYQSREEYLKALDAYKVALKLEETRGDDTANTHLNCALLLNSLARPNESLEHAGTAMTAIENSLGVKRNRPLGEYK